LAKTRPQDRPSTLSEPEYRVCSGIKNVEHKHPNVRAWLKRHPRFVCHYVPTSSSWLNLVERWFGELTSKRIRRGSFASVADLQQAIAEFLAAWNENPKPFVWTATVESIVAKLSRCRQTGETIQPGCTLPGRRKAKQ
jgi:DDE superfamily endonuclease